MTTGAPPTDTATLAALGTGTSRRLPLRACCYQVVMGYTCGAPLIIWEAQITRVRLKHYSYLSTPNTTQSPNVTQLVHNI